MQVSLQIHLFGQLQLYVDDQPWPLKAPPKTTPLLAYLLLHPGQPIPRQPLAFTLWPDEPEKKARANLRRHIHHLKHALPPAPAGRSWIFTSPKSVQWNPEADFWFDVAEFERLYAVQETLSEALAIYQGDLLQDEIDEWLFFERERLRNLYLSALVQLIQRHRRERNFSQAIALANQLLTDDPLREDTVRLLMALHYEAGDRAGALAAFKHFRSHLRAELDVEPMPETQALHEAIVQDRGLPQSPVVEAKTIRPSEASSTFALPFIGREAELEAINTWWSRAARGQGRLVLVGGEAGVGKTRLLAEFAARADSQGARLLKGITEPLEPTPYQPIAQALRAALPMLVAVNIDPLWIAAVAQLVPELRERRGRRAAPLPRLSRLDPNAERARLFEGVSRCLAGLAGPRPLVLILEDLHWAGNATISLLDHLARDATDHPILILASYRQDEVPRIHPLQVTRRSLQRANLLTHLSVPRLNPEAITLLVTQIAGPGQEVNLLAEQLYQASEGNPFFLVELIRGWMESDRTLLMPAPRQAIARAGRNIPHRVHETLARRLERLTPPARSLAEVASVIGAAFNMDLVREINGWSEAQAFKALDELLDQHLVRETERGGRFDLTFNHHLIQVAIYEGISQASRRRRHRRAGIVMEELYRERLDDVASDLARHFECGGEDDRAAGYYLRSARLALEIHADEEALEAIRHTLALTGDHRLRFDALCLQEAIHQRRGEREAQSDDLERLAGVAQILDDVNNTAEVLLRQVRFYRSLGEREREGQLIEALKDQAAASGEMHWQAEAQRVQAHHLMLLGHFDRAVKGLQEALTAFRTLEDVQRQVACLCLLAEIAVHQSHFEEAQSWLREAETLAAALGDQALLVRTLGTASRVAFTHRDYSTSAALAEQMLALCRTIGHREGEADAHARLAANLARTARIQDARQHYEKAGELYAALHKRQGEAAVLLNGGMLAVNLGQYARGIEMFQQAGALFEAMGDRRGLAAATLNLSAPAIYQGKYALARDSARRGVALSRELKAPLFEAAALGNLGEAELHLGHPQKAIQHLVEAVTLREQNDIPSEESATDLSILAQAYLEAGDLEKAGQTARTLLELCAIKLGKFPYPQQALWAAAQVHKALGDNEQAAGLLAQARATMVELAAAIPDPDSRAAFMELPFNRQILDKQQG